MSIEPAKPASEPNAPTTRPTPCAARAEQSSIVLFDNVTHIIHAAVAELDFVLVNNSVRLVMWGEVLGKKVKEFFTDIILHMFAVWWIEPDYVLS